MTHQTPARASWWRAGAWSLAFLAQAAAAQTPPPPVDVLASARAAWRGGNPSQAAALVSASKDVRAQVLGGLALLDAGDAPGALTLLSKVPANHVLFGVAQAGVSNAQRRLGQFPLARAAALKAQTARVPGASYLLADADAAAHGCAAGDAWKAALKKEPNHPGRHSARRMLLQCSGSPAEKLRVAVAILDDLEPVESDMARATLDSVMQESGSTVKLPFEVALRVVEKLFGEGLSQHVGLLLPRIAEPEDPTARTRLNLFQAQWLTLQGKREERLKLLAETLRRGAGTLESAVAKSLVDALSGTVTPEVLAARYLALAEQYPGDPVGVECRHLAAYHLSEAGKLEQAITQWDVVAGLPGPKRRDAAWFAAQKTALKGDAKGAARRALSMAARDQDSQWAAMLTYWAGRWALDAQDDEGATAAFKTACARYPARLHGFFACARLGQPPPAVPPPPPPLDDAAPALQALLAAPFHASARPDVLRASQWAEVGAWDAARALMRYQAGVLSSAGSDVALLFGEAELALGDFQPAVTLAERRRVLVDTMDNARWLRLAYPRMPVLEAAAREEGMDPAVVHAIARTESWFSPTVRSPVGAIGLMQIMPKTGLELAQRGSGAPDDPSLWNPNTNARLGSRYLRMLGEDFHGRVELIAAGYNAGPAATRKFMERGRGLPLDAFLEAINYRETRGYARRVLEATYVYRALSGQDVAADPRVLMDVESKGAVGF